MTMFRFRFGLVFLLLPSILFGQLDGSYTLSQTVGIDQFGRAFQPFSMERADRQVGMFFWLWMGQPYASAVYDATEILKIPEGKALLLDFDHQNDTITFHKIFC